MYTVEPLLRWLKDFCRTAAPTVCIQCTLFPPKAKTCAGSGLLFPSVIGNSDICGKWYGLADCLLFHSKLTGWGGGEGEWGNRSPYHYTSWLRWREEVGGLCSLPLRNTSAENAWPSHMNVQCIFCCSMPAALFKFKSFFSKVFPFSDIWQTVMQNVSLEAKWRSGWKEIGPLLLLNPSPIQILSLEYYQKKKKLAFQKDYVT